jgi:hypothetical protein
VRERPFCHPLPLNPRAQQPRLFNFLWSPNSLILESGGRAGGRRRCCQAKSIQLFSGVNFERRQKQSHECENFNRFFETQAAKSATLNAEPGNILSADYIYIFVNIFLRGGCRAGIFLELKIYSFPSL